MAILLDEILAQAVDEVQTTVTLSPQSVAVLLFATSFIERVGAWVDRSQNPEDDVTPAEAGEIEALVANLVTEVYNPQELNMALVGEIRFLAYDGVPDMFLACEGQAVSRSVYAALFALLGTAYGAGDGSTTFNLPDMRGRSPIGEGVPYLDPSGVPMVIGIRYGEQRHTLITSEMPVHNHPEASGGTFLVSNAAGSSSNIRGATAVTWQGQANTGNRGGGLSHENIHPVTVGKFVIYAGV